MAGNEGASRASAPPQPTISLLPRYSVENLFMGGAGASLGLMMPISNFFLENHPKSECRSFSQLLAGAMASLAAVTGWRPSFLMENSTKES